MQTNSAPLEAIQGGRRFCVPHEAPLRSAMLGNSPPSISYAVRVKAVTKVPWGWASFSFANNSNFPDYSHVTLASAVPYEWTSTQFNRFQRQVDVLDGIYTGTSSVDWTDGGFPVPPGEPTSLGPPPTGSSKIAAPLSPIPGCPNASTHSDTAYSGASSSGPTLTSTLSDSVNNYDVWTFTKARLDTNPQWPATFPTPPYTLPAPADSQGYSFKWKELPGTHDRDITGLDPSNYTMAEVSVRTGAQNDTFFRDLLPIQVNGFSVCNGWSLNLSSGTVDSDGNFWFGQADHNTPWTSLNLVREQGRLQAGTGPHYYWIGRMRRLANERAIDSADQSSLLVEFVRDGYITDQDIIGDQGTIALEHPTTAPFDTDGLLIPLIGDRGLGLTQAILADCYFAIIGLDVPAWTAITGHKLGFN